MSIQSQACSLDNHTNLGQSHNVTQSKSQTTALRAYLKLQRWVLIKGNLDNHTITWTVTQCQYGHRSAVWTITQSLGQSHNVNTVTGMYFVQSHHSIPPWIKLIHLLLYWVGDFSRIFMTPLPPHFFYLLVQLLPHPHIFSFIIMLNHGTFDPTPTFFHISCTPPTFYFANHSHIRTLQSRECTLHQKTWRREFLCVTSFRIRSFPSMAVT